MSTVGNGCGTWKSCAPLRSCSAASTSTASGSCDTHADRINAALSRLRELRGGDWEPCAFIRLQEELSGMDVIGLHGYLIVHLRNVEDPQLLPKFMRLDWGHDGFAVQVAASDVHFRSYFDKNGMHPGAMKAATGIAATVGFGMAGVATSVATVGAAAVATYVVCGAAVCMTPVPKYQEVGRMASMRSTIRAIEAKAEEPYELVSWNCNHFANYLAGVLRTEE